MKSNPPSPGYFLTNDRNKTLARAWLESSREDERWRVRVAEEDIPSILDQERVQLIGAQPGTPSLLGRVCRREGNIILLEPLQDLGEQARENLRMPVRFETFLYPLTGTWRGRRTVESLDLSCGGIAFFCDEPLAIGEQAEVVIPVTTHPLILRCEILRKKLRPDRAPMYAAKFVELCHEEEAMVREAVFGIQLSRRTR